MKFSLELWLPKELLALAYGVSITTPLTLILTSALFTACALQERKPISLPAFYLEQSWNNLSAPQHLDAPIEFQVKLAPASLSALAWSPKSGKQIHIDFSAQIPGFQPTQLHEVYGNPSILYVSGYDSMSGDGMILNLTLGISPKERIQCELLYRGDCFGIARDMLVNSENHLEIYVLDDDGSIQLLNLNSDIHETQCETQNSPLLSRCRYLETVVVGDLEGNYFPALRATEQKPFHGCIPSLPIGANVIMTQSERGGGFEVFMESDFKTNPLLSLQAPTE